VKSTAAHAIVFGRLVRLRKDNVKLPWRAGGGNGEGAMTFIAI
jgi:hypothetical protein